MPSVLRVAESLLFQADRARVGAISCQLLPVLPWGHLFLLLAAECLINPTHLPHLLRRLLTASLHLLAEIRCPCWSSGHLCLQQMFSPGTQSGETFSPLPSATYIYLALLFPFFLLGEFSFPSTFRLGITSTKKLSLTFSAWVRCPSSDILQVLFLPLHIAPASMPST